MFEATRGPRDRPIMVRLTPAEKRRVVELAALHGYSSPAAYIRAFLAREDAAANERNRK